MKTKTTKSVCAQVDAAHRDMLAYVLHRTKRTFKGQLELWIEQEKRLLDISEVRQ